MPTDRERGGEPEDEDVASRQAAWLSASAVSGGTRCPDAVIGLETVLFRLTPSDPEGAWRAADGR